MDLHVEGFGDFSADLLALLNSQGWSRWVPALPMRPRQHEGFAYLGVGVLSLLLVRLVMTLRSAKASARALLRLWPVLVVVLIMAFYGLSSRVTLAGERVWDLAWLYAPVQRFTDILRGSGRFVWPLHLLLVAAAVSGAAAIRSRWIARSVLLVAVLVQAIEFNPAGLDFRAVKLKANRDPAWESVGQEYRHIALVPVQILWVCPYDRGLVDRLSRQAYLSKMTINSGNVIRRPYGVKSLCGRHLPPEQELDPETIYVVDRKYLVDFRGKSAVCGELDGLLICVSGVRDTSFARALERRPIPIQ